MLQEALPLAFLMFSLMFSFLFVSNANSNIYVQCSELNFTSMSPYESNVNTLLTSLDDSASIYNFNKYETSPQSDSVYGLFQCRGDLSTLDCKDCVANATSQLKTTCPVSMGGEIQLEGCFVKYGNTSFFGVQETTEVCRRCGPSIGYNSDVLNRIDDAMSQLITGNGQYFYRGDFGSIQGVAQCVQDLSLSDCQDCLSEACGRLRTECLTSTWGDMYLGKCYIRYADQDYENLANNSNSDSSSNKSSDRGSKNNILKWIGYIIAAAVGAGSLTFAAQKCCNVNVCNIIKSLKKDIEGTKKDVESVKSEAKNLKKDVEGAKKDVESVKSEAKSAIEKAEKAEKIAKDNEKKIDGSTLIYYPYGMPMPMQPPPLCIYMPHSNPNTCYYL